MTLKDETIRSLKQQLAADVSPTSSSTPQSLKYLSHQIVDDTPGRSHNTVSQTPTSNVGSNVSHNPESPALSTSMLEEATPHTPRAKPRSTPDGDKSPYSKSSPIASPHKYLSILGHQTPSNKQSSTPLSHRSKKRVVTSAVIPDIASLVSPRTPPSFSATPQMYSVMIDSLGLCASSPSIARLPALSAAFAWRRIAEAQTSGPQPYRPSERPYLTGKVWKKESYPLAAACKSLIVIYKVICSDHNRK